MGYRTRLLAGTVVALLASGFVALSASPPEPTEPLAGAVVQIEVKTYALVDRFGVYVKGDLRTDIVTTFDGQGNTLVVDYVVGYAEDGGSVRLAYTYDTTGRLERVDGTDSQGALYRRTVYTYAPGQPVLARLYYANGSLCEAWTDEYDDAGRLTKSIDYDSNSYLVGTLTYSYAESGELSSCAYDYNYYYSTDWSAQYTYRAEGVDWISAGSPTIGATYESRDDNGNWLTMEMFEKKTMFGVEMWVPTEIRERTVTYAAG